MSCWTKVLLEQGCMCLCTQRLCFFFFLFYTKKLQSCEVIGNSVLFVHSGLWRGLIQLMICNVRKRIRAHLTERKLGDWHLKLSGKLGLLRDCGGFLRYSYLWVGGSMWDLSLSLSLSLFDCVFHHDDFALSQLSRVQVLLVLLVIFLAKVVVFGMFHPLTISGMAPSLCHVLTLTTSS